jgi:hypothetical protein
MMRATRMFRLGITAAILGCGGGDDGPGGPSPSISVDPPSATVAAGDTPVAFSATRTAVTEATTWSLEGPGTLSTTAGDVTSYTAPATLDQPTAATLTATAGAVSDQATITITPPEAGPPITVSGIVVDECRRPVANLLVWVRNRGITRTNASGGFSFTGVQTPYDIGTLQGQLIRIYGGLVIPTVRLTVASTAVARTGSFTGNLTVGAGSTAEIPVPLGRRTWLGFHPSDNSYSVGFFGDVNPYGLDVAWCGDAEVSGTLEVLQWTTQTTPVNPNLAEQFHGYGRSEGSVTEGIRTTGADVVLEAVETLTLTGTTELPAGLQVNQRMIGLDAGRASLDPALYFNAQVGVTLPSDFSLKIPDAPGIKLAVATDAQGPGGFSQTWLRDLSPSTTLTVRVDDPPAVLEPTAGSEVELGTQTFTWQSDGTGVQGLMVVLFYPLGGGGRARSLDYEIFTQGRSFLVPGPEEFGLASIPANSTGDWQVGSSNEPTVAGMVAPTRTMAFGASSLYMVLPIPESPEVRFALTLGFNTFQLR